VVAKKDIYKVRAMKRRPNLLSLTLCLSLGLHGCLLFMLSFQYQDGQREPAQKASAKAMSLVNLALIEPPKEKPAPPREAPPPTPEPVAIPEAPVAEPVETYVALEAPPESAGAPSEAVEPPASRPAPPAKEPGDAALTRTYLKNNYEYIQRHIRNKLVYPPEARRSGVQGVAELSFVIHTDGQVSDVRITTSSGSATLDASAVEAIYSAAPFRPPPSQARLVIPVAFRLR
jgi:protein TonB